MISYRLDTNLNQKALQKMEETIPPLVGLLTDILLQSNSLDELLLSIKENCPFDVHTWIEATHIPTNEVWIYLSASSIINCRMVLDLTGFITSLNRENQLKKLLE